MKLDQLISWIESNEILLLAAGIISAAAFIGTALAVPFLINLLPEDYFLKEKRRESFTSPASAFIFFILFVIKNLTGLLLLFVGIALLFMPGQGLLTIILSLVLLDFPGKWKLQKSIIRRKKIADALNWVRRRGGKRELIIPE